MSSIEPQPKLLLVEGQDDKHVVRHLCNKLGPRAEFCCRDSGSKGQLLEAISVEVKSRGRLALGIVMDADDDVLASWEAIGYQLRGENIFLPRHPELGGTVIDSDPRVGVWLMPNNSTPGELENFVTKLVPKGDPVWPLAEQYINEIPGEHRQFKEGKIPRAKLHAWLATRKEPRKMGLAVKANGLNAEAPIAVQFTDWLRALFDPPPRQKD